MSDMQINNVLAQMRAMSAQATSAVTETKATGSSDFSAMLSQSIDNVNKAQKEAEALSAAFTKGETNASLAEVMVSMQKSNLSFQTVLQTRNKIVDAYKEVMRMTM